MTSRALKKRFTVVLVCFALLVLGLWFIYHRMAFSSINQRAEENIALSTDRLLGSLGDELSRMKTVGAIIASSGYVQDFLAEEDVTAYYEKAHTVSEIVAKVAYPITVADSILTITNGGDFYRFTGSVSNRACQTLYERFGKGDEVQSIVELEGTLYFCHLSPVVTTEDSAPKRLGSVVLLNDLQKTRRLLTDGKLPGVDTAVVLEGEVLLADQTALEGQSLETLKDAYAAVTVKPVAGTALSVAALVTQDALYSGRRLFLIVSAAMIVLLLATIGLLYHYLKRSMLSPLLDTKDQMQLGLLSTQMDAHLVFNSITCIQNLSRQGENEKAAKVSEGLASILKHQHLGGSLVNIFLELEVLAQYIEIMNIRHGDKFGVSYDVEDILSDYLMPSSILQPIVENALGHGLAYQAEGCHLHISGKLTEGGILFAVTDNGAGMTQGQLVTIREKLRAAQESDFPEQGLHGVALLNIQKRIRARYGAPYGVSLESTEGCGTTVTVHLPAVRDK